MKPEDDYMESMSPEIKAPAEETAFTPLFAEEPPEGPPERKTSDEMIETMFSSAADEPVPDDEGWIPDPGNRSMPEGEPETPPEEAPEEVPDTDEPAEESSGDEDYSAFSD